MYYWFIYREEVRDVIGKVSGETQTKKYAIFSFNWVNFIYRAVKQIYEHFLHRKNYVYFQ